MENKICSKCLISKNNSVEYFRKYSYCPNRLMTVCKDCMRLKQAEYRKTKTGAFLKEKHVVAYREKQREINRKWYAKNRDEISSGAKVPRVDRPEKTKARAALNNAIVAGTVQKQPCFVCGSQKAEGHHADYGNYLGVTWLCSLHHKRLHAEHRKYVSINAEDKS